MSLYSAMRSGVSGLAAQSTRLSAISDNISNSSTVGYKRADVDFTSLVTSSGGASGYSGGGVTSSISYSVEDGGSVLGSDSSTDLAIDGNGFFVVADGMTSAFSSASYGLTRAGSFSTDDSGYLVNTAGQYLQGWALNPDGSLPSVSTSDMSDLVSINVGNISYGGSKTTGMTYSGNVPAQAASGTTFTTTGPFYDGLGNASDVTLTWTKTANANEWTLDATAPTGYTLSGVPMTVTFDATGDTAGLPSSPMTAITLTSPATPTADTITIDFSNVTQLNGDYAPEIIGDGAAVGQLSSVAVDDSGTMWAVFDNGAKKAIYQVPLATVTNVDGLIPENGNVYSLGVDCGTLTLGKAGTGALGDIAGSALEQSNVDIADELVSLIETQRAYSSNATLVRTADEMLEVTTNLKR